MTKNVKHLPAGQAANKARNAKPQTAAAELRVRDVVFKFRQQLAKIQEDLTAEKKIIRRRYAFGFQRIGDLDEIYRETDSQGRVHIVLAVAAHLLDGILHYEVDGRIVDPVSMMDQGGNVTVNSSPYRGKLRLRFLPGFEGQAADPLLVEETSRTNTFRGDSIAYIYARLIPDPVFNGNDKPEIAFIGRCARCSDPRGGFGGVSFGWSINPVVQLWHNLIEPKRRGGAGIDFARVDGDGFRAAADFAEQTVSTQNFTRTSPLFGIEFASVLIFQAPILEFQYGDVVRLVPVAGQAVPTGLSAGVDYHVIVRNDRANDTSLPTIALASSFRNAMAGVPISFNKKTKPINVRKTGEVRFSAAWSRRTNEPIGSAIDLLLRSMDGRLTWYDGRLRLVLPSFTTPKTISLGQINSGVALTPKVDRAERTTRLTGEFISPLNLYLPKDAPPVGGAFFEEIDRGEFDKRHELTFVDRVSQAQRIELIELRRRRQERRISFSTMLSAWEVRAGQFFTLDNPVLGIDEATTWQVTQRQLFTRVEDSKPRYSLDFQARQVESATFDLAASDQAFIGAIALPNLKDARITEPPGGLTVTETLVQTQVGGGLKIRMNVHWAASPDPFLLIYRLRFQGGTAAAATVIETPDLDIEVLDVEPGTYSFELVAINTLGVLSAPRTLTATIRGAGDPPAAPTLFRLQQTGANILLTWDPALELDVRVGGAFEVWHHFNEQGDNSANALLLSDEIPGDLTNKTLPVIRGQFYLRKRNQRGRHSPFVRASTEGLAAVPFARLFVGELGAFDPTDLVADEASLQADPSWLDANAENSVVFEEGYITLPSIGDLDDLGPTWDEIGDGTNFDAAGEVAPEAVYYFPSGIEFSDLTRFRVETQIEAVMVDEINDWDSRPGLVDDAISWDVNAEPGTADAWIEARTSRSPGAEDDFSDWKRVYTADFFRRTIEFRVVLRSSLPTVNIQVYRARIFLREIFEPGAVEPQPDGLTIPVSISGIPVPRVGYTTPREAAFSTSVCRVGFTLSEPVNQALINRIASESTYSVIGNGMKSGVYAGSSPWTGSGSSTVFTADFTFTNARIDEFLRMGIPNLRIHNFFWPLFPDAFGSASPATDATNILDRMRTMIEVFVRAYGPPALQGRGDLVSGTYIDLVNEWCDSNATGTDLVHNGGPFVSALGTDWFYQVIGEFRSLFPPSCKLGWNEFGMEHGFNPVPVPDATTGADYTGDVGGVLFGYTNSTFEVRSRQRILRAAIEAIEAGMGPDFIGLQFDINGAQGSNPVDQALYLDLPSLKDFCCELFHRDIEVQITEARLNYGSGDEDTLIQADADQFAVAVPLVINNSKGTICNGWNEFLAGPYIGVYEQNGTPSTARGANSVDLYKPWMDGIAAFKPLAIRVNEVPREASRLLVEQVSAMQRPLIWSATPGSGSFNGRAGWLSRFQTAICYCDFDDLAFIDFDDAFSVVLDVWMFPDAATSPNEVWLHFSTGTSTTDCLRIIREDTNDRFQLECLVSGSSIISGPLDIATTPARAGVAGDFPDGNTGSSILQAEALTRSTRLALSINRTSGVIRASFNGNAAISATASGTIPAFDRVYIGSNPTHSNADVRAYGRIRRPKFYDGEKTAAQLVALSAAVWGSID